MFCASFIIHLNRWLINADILRINGVPNLWATRGNVRLHIRQDMIGIGTDALLEGKQVTLGESVRFGNDRDKVHAGTETLHDLNVQRLETKTWSDDT
jgi:hypothetical protein